LGTGCVGTATSGPRSFSIGAPAGGDMVGSARSFPNFVLPWRGIAQGENAAGSYIRGWETFATYQFNLGSTYVATPRILGMDQAIILFEVAATWVPDMPDQCELSLEGPGTFTHASRGADGTGSPGFAGRLCDAPNSDLVDGADGLRFNPTQQVEGYPTRLSWGWRAVLNPRWESILPGISAQSFIIFSDDVRGTSPEPAGNFLEGRQSLVMNNELRFGSHWSLNLGYIMFRGGEPFNLLSDRDHGSLWVRYNF
jgi:hypothetical protein